MDNNRYITQSNIINHNCQKVLENAKVLCIGAGGLGCLVSSFLAAAGVGNIGLIDQETIDINHLNNQVIYTKQDIGKWK